MVKDNSFKIYNNSINKIINKIEIYNLVIYLFDLYNKKKLLEQYFEPINGINPKTDIYSLGLVCFEIYMELKIENVLITELIKNMLELYSMDRYSIKDCLNHNIN